MAVRGPHKEKQQIDCIIHKKVTTVPRQGKKGDVRILEKGMVAMVFKQFRIPGAQGLAGNKTLMVEGIKDMVKILTKMIGQDRPPDSEVGEEGHECVSTKQEGSAWVKNINSIVISDNQHLV